VSESSLQLLFGGGIYWFHIGAERVGSTAGFFSDYKIHTQGDNLLKMSNHYMGHRLEVFDIFRVNITGIKKRFTEGGEIEGKPASLENIAEQRTAGPFPEVIFVELAPGAIAFF